jgi:hypothetical protein
VPLFQTVLQGCLCSEQPWKIKIVSPSGAGNSFFLFVCFLYTDNNGLFLLGQAHISLLHIIKDLGLIEFPLL